MTTQLTQRLDKPSEPTSSNIFGIVSSALAQTSRRLGCWDSSRFIDSSQRMNVEPDASVTPETLAYAYATS